MAVFPSEEWCRLAIEAANADPDAVEAGEGWEGDIAVIVEAEPPHVRVALAAWVEPVEGRLEGFRLLEDLDEIDELEPAYVARAPYSVWKGLIQGTLDPIEAVLKRRIQLQGDVQQVIERARYKELINRVLARVPTTFIDEGK